MRGWESAFDLLRARFCELRGDRNHLERLVEQLQLSRADAERQLRKTCEKLEIVRDELQHLKTGGTMSDGTIIIGTVRGTEAERAAIKQRAEEAGMTLAAWMRERLRLPAQLGDDTESADAEPAAVGTGTPEERGVDGADAIDQ